MKTKQRVSKYGFASFKKGDSRTFEGDYMSIKAAAYGYGSRENKKFSVSKHIAKDKVLTIVTRDK